MCLRLSLCLQPQSLTISFSAATISLPLRRVPDAILAADAVKHLLALDAEPGILRRVA